ncbi:uncharacterized protein B0T15DRAFT_525183 [Chaetomium strumarium]|uniref:Uncharacterized protein n=1 Tax=Chaetomium strumarium TaxID=1170767 RepID=A0AAJ0M4Q5_9PEZI|nr:hypothetical protein B0T15DRAFT_525183 [Chaetomium strumarium]
MSLYNALIRTHHITSRQKIAHLRKAAKQLDVYALLRTGAFPGIMYCQGSEHGVNSFVTTVQGLRYKDFKLASRPAPIESDAGQAGKQAGLFEVASVQEFATVMDVMGLSNWWKRAMEFA